VVGLFLGGVGVVVAVGAWPHLVKACCSCQEYPDEIAATILASARRWVAAYAHKPEMLKPLWKWLSSGAWKNMPPSPAPKRNAGKASLAAIAKAEGQRGGGDQ
jgi:hypothetical protein